MWLSFFLVGLGGLSKMSKFAGTFPPNDSHMLLLVMSTTIQSIKMQLQCSWMARFPRSHLAKLHLKVFSAGFHERWASFHLRQKNVTSAESCHWNLMALWHGFVRGSLTGNECRKYSVWCATSSDTQVKQKMHQLCIHTTGTICTNWTKTAPGVLLGALYYTNLCRHLIQEWRTPVASRGSCLEVVCLEVNCPLAAASQPSSPLLCSAPFNTFDHAHLQNWSRRWLIV